MRATVVYESMFGNTKRLAEAVSEALAEHMAVELLEVSEAPKELGPETDLLVVGAPTHAYSLSRPSTRQEAAMLAPQGLVSKGIGVREWLGSVSAPHPPPAAVFDTRFDQHFSGRAALAAIRRLREAGFRILDRPESFRVERFSGPLAADETARARRFGERLAARWPAVGR